MAVQLDRRLITPIGFVVGFAPVAFWYFLNWAPFAWSVVSGVVVAVLSSVLWAFPSMRQPVRLAAAIGLALMAVGYGSVVFWILSVSDCGFADGRLYCINRFF